MLAPPEPLTSNTKVDQPPAKPLSKKVLVKAWISQTSNLEQCNVDKQGIREWVTSQKSLYGGQ